jgi:uncharacterized membrane protein YuzA (DUF378 family)
VLDGGYGDVSVAFLRAIEVVVGGLRWGCVGLCKN